VTWQLFWEWKTSSTTMALMVSADLKPKKVIVDSKSSFSGAVQFVFHTLD
jgi:hypothetical protein